MQPIELSTPPLHLSTQRGPLPALTRPALIACLAAVAQLSANNAEADAIIDACYSPPLAQSPRDSIPQFERAS
jgi:hypothetical protein